VLFIFWFLYFVITSKVKDILSEYFYISMFAILHDDTSGRNMLYKTNEFIVLEVLCSFG